MGAGLKPLGKSRDYPSGIIWEYQLFNRKVIAEQESFESKQLLGKNWVTHKTWIQVKDLWKISVCYIKLTNQFNSHLETWIYVRVDHHTRGKSFIHAPKHYKENLLLSMELSLWLSLF